MQRALKLIQENNVFVWNIVTKQAKTINCHKRQQTISKSPQMTSKDHTSPVNDHRQPQTTSKQPQTTTNSHSHKKRKDSLETRAVLLIFLLELELSGVAVQGIYQNSKKLKLLCKNNFKAVLVTFCCYAHGNKASEKVQKIATDKKEYRKCFLYVIICWITKIYLTYQSMKVGWLQGYLQRS